MGNDIQRSVLPVPDLVQHGLTTYDAKDPDTSYPPIREVRPPAGAPNVLVILLDDAGFGAPLDGASDYLCHFEPGALPPADAFWSITMYDEHGFQATNRLNRFAIGDRDPLTYNSDGSLDIYMQHSSPGAGKESNWLPAPEGPLGVTMRIYAPRAEALDGRWNSSPVRRVR